MIWISIPFTDGQIRTFILGCFNFCISSLDTAGVVAVCGSGIGCVCVCVGRGYRESAVVKFGHNSLKLAKMVNVQALGKCSLEIPRGNMVPTSGQLDETNIMSYQRMTGIAMMSEYSLCED